MSVTNPTSLANSEWISELVRLWFDGFEWKGLLAWSNLDLTRLEGRSKLGRLVRRFYCLNPSPL